MQTVRRLADGILFVGMVVMLAIILASVCLEVFWRFALGGSLPWTGELATLGLVWMVFLAGSYAVSTRANIRIEILVIFLAEETRRRLDAAIDLLLLVLFGVLLVVGWQYTRIIASASTYTLQISQAYFYAAVPVAACFMLFYTILHVLGRWSPPPAADGDSQEGA
jgi:TRAP-type C4-dicarboxylate transport system permease small subunit